MLVGAQNWKAWRDSACDFVVDLRVVISVVVLATFIAVHLYAVGEAQAVDGLIAGDFVGALLICTGVVLRSWAAGYLRKGCDLTTKGPYSLCRHPLYVGSWLLFVGFAAMLRWWSYLTPVTVILSGVYAATTLREERRMAQKFGSRWHSYAAKTPRFVPWRPDWYAAGIWDVRQWIRSREYRAATAALVCLCGILVVRRCFGV